VDDLTGLVAVPVQNLSTGDISWFVLDLKDPKNPKVVHQEPNLKAEGGFSNGVLFGITTAGKVVAKRIVGGIAGVDEGPCCTFQAQVDIAMDGNRSGKDDLIGIPGNDRYLFWVNDDCDATSGSSVRKTRSPPPFKWMTTNKLVSDCSSMDR
jgi:hypothetical protein